MRRCLFLIVAANLFVGCTKSAPPSPLASLPSASRGSNAPASGPDAHQIVEQAIAAFGGTDARLLLRRGYVKMMLAGDLPEVSERFGTDTLTFEAYFDLPDFERRDIYGDPDGEHFLAISNSGRLWTGNQAGKGQQMSAPPRTVYRGPFLVGIMQNIIELRDNTSKLVLIDGDSNSAVDVVEAYIEVQLVSRVSFDRDSHLPSQILKISPSMRADNFAEPDETVTKLSQYRQFGSATLPTDVVIVQGGKQLLRVTLVSADFDAPVAKEQFVIPDGSAASTGAVAPGETNLPAVENDEPKERFDNDRAETDH